MSRANENKCCKDCVRGKQFTDHELTCHLQPPYGANQDIIWPVVHAMDFCPAFEAEPFDITEAMARQEKQVLG